MTTTYDRKSYDLAAAFLEDGPIGINHEKRIHELALHLQSSIEDWIEMNPPQLEPTP